MGPRQLTIKALTHLVFEENPFVMLRSVCCGMFAVGVNRAAPSWMNVMHYFRGSCTPNHVRRSCPTPSHGGMNNFQAAGWPIKLTGGYSLERMSMLCSPWRPISCFHLDFLYPFFCPKINSCSSVKRLAWSMSKLIKIPDSRKILMCYSYRASKHAQIKSPNPRFQIRV